jgi:hypothetical protein
MVRKLKRTALGAKEIVREIARLFDRYGIDRSPGRDRSCDGERFQQALYLAVSEGLLRVPHASGASSKWKGKLGLELVEAVETLQVQRGFRRTGPAMRLKPTKSVSQAIRELRLQDPDKWEDYLSGDLEKRYYEAKKYWTYPRRLIAFSDPWHKDHHVFTNRRQGQGD